MSRIVRKKLFMYHFTMLKLRITFKGIYVLVSQITFKRDYFNSETLRSYCIICLLNHRCQFHCMFICYLQNANHDNKNKVWIVSKKFINTSTNHFQTCSYIFVLPITFKRDHIYLFHQSLSNVIIYICFTNHFQT